MTSRRLPLTAFALLMGTLLTAPAATHGNAAAPAPADREAHVRLDSLRPPEVRLRKLHLVRPDLIMYPIEYEVVC
jgi:hypothetical protein